jgi:hypothetical protein
VERTRNDNPALFLSHSFIVVAHQRRHAIHFNVTAHPTKEWTAQQIAEAFPGIAPRVICCMIAIAFTAQRSISELGKWASANTESTQGAPWQNPYAERFIGFIGSLRRECLDHIIAFNESSLRRIVKAYFEYYEYSRTHLALDKDAPASRAIRTPALGSVIGLPQLGGLHHRYQRRTA